MKKRLSILFFLILQGGFLLFADPGNPGLNLQLPEPELNCRSAVLMDYQTGRVLFQKNADEVIPPASMTKLATAYTFLLEAEKGKMGLDDTVTIGAESDFRSAPPHSSLMFLEEGQNVTVRELLIGLTVPSGNDAAVAMAVYTAGGVDAFVSLMNANMKKLGLKSTRFVEPSGYSENNITTAREFALFCRSYIQTFPDISLEISSVRDFTYPKPKNMTDGKTSALGLITQPNHNELIGRYSWVDGLKTGFIKESGYNVALTAETGGRRLVCVIMGIEGENGKDAGMKRIADGVNLLSYGFYAFTNVTVPAEALEPLRVYRGTRKQVPVSGDDSGLLCLNLSEAASLRKEFVPEGVLTAPIMEGDVIGFWTLYTGDERLGTYPVKAAEPVEEGGFFRRIFGSIALWFIR